jgi:hypothetical protein
MRPCQHPLHLDCLKTMIDGYAETRNKCPLCREVFFKLNILSPENEALRLKDEATYYDSTAHFDTEAYAELITRADELFTEQVKRYAAHGTEDYVRIITEVR